MKTLFPFIFMLAVCVSVYASQQPMVLTEDDLTPVPLNLSSVSEDMQPYLVAQYLDPDGEVVNKVLIPGSPPSEKNVTASVDVVPLSAVILFDVPKFNWTYGCTATSAGMLCGYYDRNGYPDMYSGSVNSGLCPLNNSGWGSATAPGSDGECSFVASHQGIDGRASYGHVDDFWENNDQTGDPYYGNWTPHCQPGGGDCLGDYLGTSQYYPSNLENKDGWTIYYYWSNGSKNTYAAFGNTMYGVKCFAEWCGYTVQEYYTQQIAGYDGNTAGFSFQDFMDQIDAGQPVMIHLTDHTMLGVGYDESSQTMYLHDTWDYNLHSMTWAGSYSGSAHHAMSVLVLGEVIPDKPDLTPSANGGRAYPIIASTVQGTITDADIYTTDDYIYVDFGMKNMGVASAEGTVQCALYLDGVYKTSLTTSSPFGINSSTTRLDANIGKLAAGQHTLKIVCDHNDYLDESDESNNDWDRTITVIEPPPSNDNFADASELSGISGSVNGSNVNASDETGEPTHHGTNDSSVWWRWTAPSSGSVVFDTIGSSFDTEMAGYTGSSLPSLVLKDDDDDSGEGRTSQITFSVIGGTTYYIAVDGYSSNTGEITLNWVLTPDQATGPLNDNFALATVLTGSSGAVSGSNVGGTEETGEPAHAGESSADNSVWWFWRASDSGNVVFDTQGSSFDTVLGVYSGSAVGSLIEITSNDDALGTASRVSFDVVKNSIYRIAVAGFNGEEGDISLNWNLFVLDAPVLTGSSIVNYSGTKYLRISFKVKSGSTYTLKTKSSLSESNWVDVSPAQSYSASSNGEHYFDVEISSSGSRFFNVTEE